MAKVVEIPGVGNVEFPDEMSDDQIGNVIKGQILPKPDYAPLEGSGPERLVQAAWANTGAPLVQAAKNVMTQGVQGLPSAGDIWHGITDPMAAEREKARQSLQPGPEYSGPEWYQAPLEAAGHALAGAVPVFGPMAAHAAERAFGGTQPTLDKFGNVIQPGTQPDPWGGAGEGVGAVGSVLGPRAALGTVKTGVAAVQKTGQLASILAKGIPDAEKAAATLDQVGQSAGHLPIDVSGPGRAALDAQRFASRGTRTPGIIKKFVERVTDPQQPPMTFDEGRDWYMNAASPSNAEFQRISGPMQKFAGDFRKELHNSLANTAEQAQAGLGNTYNAAIDEYRRAMQWAQAKKELMNIAVKQVLPRTLAYGLPAWLWERSQRAQGGFIIDRYPSRESILASLRR